MKVRIEYCVTCGHLGRAIGLAEQILAVFKTTVSALELVPVPDGAFEVVVDGELIHSKKATGIFPTWVLVEEKLSRRGMEPAGEGAAVPASTVSALR